MIGILRDGVTEQLEPIFHSDDTRDSTGIVTKEDTTEGGEANHQDANKAVLVGGGTDACAGGGWSTWHCERVRGVS